MARTKPSQPITATAPPTSTPTETGPIFFWREEEQPHGFLCQYFYCTFTAPEIHASHVFTSAEQYVMYRKSLVIAGSVDGTLSGLPSTTASISGVSCASSPQKGDGSGAKRQKSTSNIAQVLDKDRLTLPSRILTAQSPDVAKYLASSHAFTRAQEKIWREISSDVVVAGNKLKFSQDAGLKAKLLATGERMLVEAAPNDRTWGIGFSAEEAVGNESRWGENKLGNALMEVRAWLREQEVEDGGDTGGDGGPGGMGEPNGDEGGLR